MKESAAYILAEVKDTLDRIDAAAADAVVDALIKARVIFIYGVGRSGLVGKAFSVRLVQMGLDVHFIGDTTTPIVEKEDLVLIISNTGETWSALQTANIIGRLGATVVSITSSHHSKLARASLITVEIAPHRNEKKVDVVPMGTLFEDATFIFLDSIVPELMQKLGQTAQSMYKRHAIWV
jgi:6-phospho-3-hexuloisomerase